ncbi:interleukin-1 receptor type 2 isoform X2 [Salarias fasciatus]|uniref:Ig-like domain-containing protein n=2 Tax=Salarias fasciatus TaxID=181472 RepID=A0A672HXP0_SALFA|nr:interleukin-1 receptor type 2 isoform X2 [Salarias fasciatus]XP_029968690.1 interleukin-1 receptor type 2 isoform X2 [Salarias fasciatus]
MSCWVLLLVLGSIGGASGRPPLPALPVKDGCYLVTPEVEVFRVEGEAVILHFPFFARALEVRSIAPPAAGFLIRRENRTEEPSPQDGPGPRDPDQVQQDPDRVQQHRHQLWLLPARVSDSGEYTCTYRNETFCVRGSVTLHMLASPSVDVELLSYPVSAAPGDPLRLSCPSLGVFNRTDRPVQWFKDSNGTALGGAADGDRLLIPAVRTAHAGVYTCRLRVTVSQRQFTVSRVILLHVEGSDPETAATPPTDPPATADPGPPSSSVHTPVLQPPLILSPLNGSVWESPHGSGLEMSCVVLTDCRLADSTQVTWLVNGQSLETSYLDRKALQGWRRVSVRPDGCRLELRLMVSQISEEDQDVEVACVAHSAAGRREVVTRLRLEDSTFTWAVVGAAAACCFLAVVSVFLFVLFRPERKKRRSDYILARQSSSF